MKSRVGLVVAGLLAALPGAAQAAVSLTVGDAIGAPGQTVEVSVTVNIDGGDVVGSLDATVGFAAPLSIPARGTSTTNADCTALVENTLAQFRFVPTGCAAGACTGVRAAILGPEGGYTSTAAFYTCKVIIAADAAQGDYPLTVPDAAYATPDGTEIAITGEPGTVTVEVEPTAVPTHTNSPTPPPTNTPTRTNTPVPTATRTVTATFPPSSPDDGCQMGAGDSSNALLALLLPIAAVAVLRRREH